MTNRGNRITLVIMGKPRRLSIMRTMLARDNQRALVSHEWGYNLKDTDIKAMLKKGHVKLIRVSWPSFGREYIQHSYIELTKKGRKYLQVNMK